MKLRRVGFFKELSHGFPDGPSLAQSVRPVATADESGTMQYLSNGAIFIVSPGVVFDVLKPDKPIGTPTILTDGIWAWPADLAYYVKTYHVDLPAEFISHARRRDWKAPAEDGIALESLEL